jgi:PAS domain S-box-containing protein
MEFAMITTSIGHLEAQEIYRLLADFTIDWDELLDSDGNYVYISPACGRISGYPPQEFSQNPDLLFEIIHPDDRASVMAHYKHLRERETYDFICMQFRLITRNGEERWIEHCCQSVFHPETDRVWHRARNRDISPQKQVEEALKTNQELYRAVIYNAPAYIVVLDSSGKIILANHKIEHSENFSSMAIIGKNIFSVLPPRMEFQELIQRALTGEEVTGQFNAENGRYFETHFSAVRGEEGQVQYVVCVATDISERVRNEAALRESTEIVKTLINLPTDIGVLVDVDGKILAASDALARRAGLEMDELIGTNLWNLFSPQVCEYRKAIAEQVRESGSPVRFDDIGSLVPNDTTIYDAVAYPIKNSKGEVIQIAVLARDITERRHLETSLQQKDAILHNIISNAPITLMAVDKMGIITFIEGEQLENFGLDANRGVGQHFVEYFSAYPSIIDDLKKALSGDEVSQPFHLDDGHWYDTRHTPIRDTSGQVVGAIAVGIDVTDYILTREALRHSKDQLQVILEGIADGVHVWDKTGELVYANQGTTWLHKYLSTNSIPELDNVLLDIELLDESGNPISLEELPGRQTLSGISVGPKIVCIRHRETGQEKWAIFKSTPILDKDGAVQMAVVITHDITEIKKAEIELKESELRYRVLVETSPDGIALIDQNTNFKTLNHQFAEIFGYRDPREFLEKGLTGFTLGRDEDKPRMLEDIARAIQSGSIFQREYLAQRKDGTYIPVEVSASKIPQDDGELSSFVVVLRDITERKKVQQELEKARQELEQRVQERTIQLAQVNEELRAEIDFRKEVEQQIRSHAARTEALARVAARINLQLDLELVFQAVCEEAIRVIPVMKEAIIRLYDEQEDELVVAAIMGSLWEKRNEISPLPRNLYEKLTNPSSPVTVIPDLLMLPDLPGQEKELLASWQLRSCVTIDLTHDGSLIGCLQVASIEEAYAPTQDELVLLQALADQAALAIANAGLFAQVSESRERLQTLSQKLVEVQEQERRSLARELHDEIGSTLTSLKMKLALSSGQLASSQLTPEEHRAELDQIQEQMNLLLQRVRDLSLDLRPALLDDLGLMPALIAFIERYQHQTGIHVNFKHTGLDRRFPVKIETTAFRIVQEALTNIARHTQVGKASVRLWSNSQILGLQIEDHGRGFEPKHALKTISSAGLSGMQERAASCGGQLEIESHPDMGTILTAELPLSSESLREGG